jgi:hypothetical protein
VFSALANQINGLVGRGTEFFADKIVVTDGESFGTSPMRISEADVIAELEGVAAVDPQIEFLGRRLCRRGVRHRGDCREQRDRHRRGVERDRRGHDDDLQRDHFRRGGHQPDRGWPVGHQHDGDERRRAHPRDRHQARHRRLTRSDHPRADC